MTVRWLWCEELGSFTRLDEESGTRDVWLVPADTPGPDEVQSVETDMTRTIPPRIPRRSSSDPGFLRILVLALVFVAFVAGTLAVNAWAVMLVAGGIGHVFDAPAWHISYLQAVVVTLALGIVGGFFKQARS